jgi:hypothetical protein
MQTHLQCWPCMTCVQPSAQVTRAPGAKRSQRLRKEVEHGKEEGEEEDVETMRGGRQTRGTLPVRVRGQSSRRSRSRSRHISLRRSPSQPGDGASQKARGEEDLRRGPCATQVKTPTPPTRTSPVSPTPARGPRPGLSAAQVIHQPTQHTLRQPYATPLMRSAYELMGAHAVAL